MSYFAILHKDPDVIDVVHCHINLWFWNRRMLFDVGLGLRQAGGGEALNSIKIAIPFIPTRGTRPADIVSTLNDADTATLVFGESVSIDSKRRITIGDRVLQCTGCSLAPTPNLDSQRGSVWTIETSHPLPPDGCIYLRVRFDVAIGAWQKQGGGHLLDFRVADSRGASISSSWKSQSKEFVKIPMINVFAIVSAARANRASSPDFQYVRLLEGEPWARYLAPVKERDIRKKMVAYYWRSKEPVTEMKPFRCFLHLGPERSGVRVGLQLAGTSLLIALWLTLFEWISVSMEGWLRTGITVFLALVGLVMAKGGLGWVLTKLSELATIAGALRRSPRE